MPSSISNSNSRAEKYLNNNRWLLFWSLIFLLFFLVVGLWEVSWRYRGFVPSVNDDWPIWSSIRRQANNNENAIALVGASRILLGIDPAILEETLKRPVLMLAIDGSNPLPVLANLANDPDFKGDVICSLPPYWLAGDDSTSDDRTKKWLRKYSSQPLSSIVETHLSLLVQANLVFRYSGLSPSKLWEKWHEGETVQPPYAPMRPDRYRRADYSLTDLASLREARVQRTKELHKNGRMLDRLQFMKRISLIQESVDNLQSKGGDVLFISLPTCGQVKVIEEAYVPKHLYWDVFSQEIDAFTIHSDIDIQFQSFNCTDGSHLNYDDAARFTRKIGLHLQEKEFL